MKTRICRFHPVLMLLACVLALTPASALGASFTFSYVYDDGDILTGAFDGDANGDLIENISNLTASYEGTSLGTDPLQLPPAGVTVTFSGGPSGSDPFNFEGNGFSGPLPVGFSLKEGGIPVVLLDGQLVQGLPGGAPYDAGSWTVVPEPATSLLVLSGMLALAARRRRP